MRPLVVAHRLSCPLAYGISVPWPGTEPKTPALHSKFLTTGPWGMSPGPWFNPKDSTSTFPGTPSSLLPATLPMHFFFLFWHQSIPPSQCLWICLHPLVTHPNFSLFGSLEFYFLSTSFGLPWWLSGKESACNAGEVGSIPGSGKSPGGRNGNPYPVLSHGLRSLVGYGPWECSRTRLSDWAHMHVALLYPNIFLLSFKLSVVLGGPMSAREKRESPWAMFQKTHQEILNMFWNFY